MTIIPKYHPVSNDPDPPTTTVSTTAAALGDANAQLSSVLGSLSSLGRNKTDVAGDLKNLALSSSDADFLSRGFGGLKGMGNLSFGPIDGMKRPKKKKSEGGGILALIKMIIGVIELPVRFSHLMAATLHTSLMLVKSVEGIGKSTVLGIKDISLFLYAILRVFVKYGKCIPWPFIVLTMCGFTYFITFICYMMYFWLIYMPINTFDKAIGSNFLAVVDDALAIIWWPEAIDKLCYTCFGEKIYLKDFLDDLESVKEVGRMVKTDFEYRIPKYMEPGKPSAKLAKKELDKAFK
jgi:hypothetical protein